MPISIRSRLLLLVTLVLLPAVAATAWLVVQATTLEREALERTLRDSSHALSMLVDRELDHRATIARMLAASGALIPPHELSPEQRSAFEQQARRALQGLGGWVALRSAEMELIDTRWPEASLPRPRKGPDPLDEQALIGSFESADGRHAAAVQPVQHEGRTWFNVTVTLPPAELQKMVERQQFPAGWVGAVLDPRGVLVARHPGGASPVGRGLADELRRHLAAGSEGLFHASSLDGTAMTGYHSSSARGWRYVSALPDAGFASGLPKVVTALGLATLALLALAAAAALWVARGFVRPVKLLHDAAARLRCGQPVALQRTGIVECDAVAAALAEASAATQHHRAELEQQVAKAVANARLTEQRASQSQRVEALGRLTGGVAHDFNNLLGVISNSAHLIQRRSAAPDLAAPLAAMLRAVETGSRLTQHLLRFSGRHPTRPTRLDLSHYLADVRELMALVLGRRIEVAVSVAPGTHSITVDYSELELALINLALNARDALPGGGHVWFAAANATAEDSVGLAAGNYVLITVSDDGVGVDETIVDRVFEPFFTTKVTQPGSGLGLSQVHGFCTQAGGVARLASTRGMGTTVSLLIPAAMPAAAAKPPGTANPQQLQGVRVLLVEDNEELAVVTAGLLASYGCVVEPASGAAEALQRIESGQALDVVLSDVVMPGGMDGVDLARRLRDLRPRLPVVLISGYSSAQSNAQDLLVLHKPCTPEELTGAIAAAVRGAQALP